MKKYTFWTALICGYLGSSTLGWTAVRDPYASPRNITWALEVGQSTNFHYDHSGVSTTPPNFFASEAQLSLWYKQISGLYLLYGRDLFSASGAQLVGMGLRLPLVTFPPPSYFHILRELSFKILVNFSNYSFVAPTPPDTYVASGWALRYGIGGFLGLFNSPLYFNVTVQAGYISGNFFLAPYVGLGFRF